MAVARFMPGFRLVTGDQLNRMVDALNGVTNPTTAPTSIDSGGVAVGAATQGTDKTPVVTETYIVEVYVPFGQTFTGIAILNGTLVAGNIRMSMATAAGAPIAAAITASTVAAGPGAYQKLPFTAPWVAAGVTKYYAMLQCNNTGYRFRAHAVGLFGASVQAGSTFGTFPTITTPPLTFTPDVGPICSLYT